MRTDSAPRDPISYIGSVIHTFDTINQVKAADEYQFLSRNQVIQQVTMSLEASRLTIQDVTKMLKLEPHPEGGFFAPTFTDENTVAYNDMPSRSASTTIYFLLTPSSFSQIHRLDAAEGWHHYAGLPIEVVELHESGPKVTRLGKDLARGERPQYIVKENTWFGSVMADTEKGQDDGDGTNWSLVGCTVAPAFEWSRFELGEREKLIKDFATSKAWIERLTPDSKS